MSLTLALSKGRILQDTLPLLSMAGIELLEDPETTRKLIVQTSHPEIRIVMVRATDVPAYVENGAADLGVAGKDVLMEHGAEGVYEPLDLQIARCKLMVAGKIVEQLPPGRLRIATKFVRLTQAWYAARGEQVDVIKLYGSMELAPLMGLADRIVDVVDTGKTLLENGLEPKELICSISSRLIVNKASLRRQHRLIKPLTEKLAEAVRYKMSAAEAYVS